MSETQSTEVSKDIQEQQKTENKSDLFVVYQNELANASPKAKEDIALVQELLTEYWWQFQQDTLKNLSTPEFKQRITKTGMWFENNISLIVKFIDKKSNTQTVFDVAEVKTYIESKSVIKNNLEDIDDNDLKEINLEKNNKTSTLEVSREYLKSTNIEKQDKILSDISEKLSPKTSEITSLPTYQAEKTTFEQQLWKKVDDNYFVTRFALGHIDEPNSYLTQADLWGEKKEDLIARLNEKYNVNEVISLQDKTFQNNQFDGRVNGQTRQEIATKWWSFETVFTAAELEFYKKDSQLRNNLHGLVQWGIFAEAKSVTNDKNYWNWEKDATTWIPKNALQNDQAFLQWMEKNQIPNTVKAWWMKYYTEVYKKNMEKPQNELTDWEKNEQALFLQNIAWVEAATYRNTVQESTTKIIAESLFADIAAMTGKDIAWASDWKLLKQSTTGDYFAMDADWNTKMAYQLNGVQWDIVIDKNWVVTMWPVLWQEAWYSDLIAKKRQVWQILWVTNYIAMVDKIVSDSWNPLRNVSTDMILSELRKNIAHDTVATEVTKASMQTNIARQSMFDTILSKTNSSRTNDIKSNLNTSTFSDKPLVSWIDKNDYAIMLMKAFEYSKISSKSQIESVTHSYNNLQQYLIKHPEFTESTNIKNNPEHIANVLNKFPIDRWSDIKILREKEYKAQQDKATIDNELATLEQKIDNNYR